MIETTSLCSPCGSQHDIQDTVLPMRIWHFGNQHSVFRTNYHRCVCFSENWAIEFSRNEAKPWVKDYMYCRCALFRRRVTENMFVKLINDHVIITLLCPAYRFAFTFRRLEDRVLNKVKKTTGKAIKITQFLELASVKCVAHAVMRTYGEVY